MITAALDTNVLASGFIRSHSTPGRLLVAWSTGAFRLVVSEHILAELAQTFADPYFQQRRSAEHMAEDLALLREKAVLTAITILVEGAATHPEDDVVLATGVSARADYLVTGNAQLQRLGSYRGMSIVSPRQFLDILMAPVPPTAGTA